MFSFVFDVLGVKYISRNDAFHFIDTPDKKYPGITIEWSGRTFLGIHLDWDYTKQNITLYMPNYDNKALSIFQNKKPKHDQHSPHTHATPNYGVKIQYSPTSTTSNIIESQII